MYEIRIKDKYGNWAADPVDGGRGGNNFDTKSDAIDFINVQLEPGGIWDDIDPDDIDVFWIKKILASALCDADRDAFSARFYELWEASINAPFDTDTPAPWGCPWYHGNPVTLEGDDIEEMAENYFEDVKDEIREALQTKTTL